MTVTLPKWTPLIACVAVVAFAAGWLVGGASESGWWTEVTAAWVQAGGALAAIAGAIWISSRDAARAREQAQAELDRRHDECRRGIVLGRDLLANLAAAIGPAVPPDTVIDIEMWLRRLSAAGQTMSFCAEKLSRSGIDHAKTMGARVELAAFSGELAKPKPSFQVWDLGDDHKNAVAALKRVNELLTEFDAGIL